MHTLKILSVVKEYNGMILEVIRAVNINSRVFPNVTLCRSVSVYRSSPKIVLNMMVKTTASSENIVNTYHIHPYPANVENMVSS